MSMQWMNLAKTTINFKRKVGTKRAPRIKYCYSFAYMRLPSSSITFCSNSFWSICACLSASSFFELITSNSSFRCAISCFRFLIALSCFAFSSSLSFISSSFLYRLALFSIRLLFSLWAIEHVNWRWLTWNHVFRKFYSLPPPGRGFNFWKKNFKNLKINPPVPQILKKFYHNLKKNNYNNYIGNNFQHFFSIFHCSPTFRSFLSLSSWIILTKQ